jgi:hypothetical protein
MARDDLHFRLRIPEALKARIEESAAQNNRSMTAEIVSRLERSYEFAEELEGGLADAVERIEALERHVATLLQHTGLRDYHGN